MSKGREEERGKKVKGKIKLGEEKMKYGNLDIKGYIIKQHSFNKLVSK